MTREELHTHISAITNAIEELDHDLDQLPASHPINKGWYHGSVSEHLWAAIREMRRARAAANDGLHREASTLSK